MKKFLFLFALCLPMGCLWAQSENAETAAGSQNDKIITVKSEVIEAVIIEVGDEVKYKKVSNPNGPTFSISTDNISSIIYSNGDVQAFSHKKNSSVQNPQQTASAEQRGSGGVVQANMSEEQQRKAFEAANAPKVGWHLAMGAIGTIGKAKGQEKVGGSIGGNITFGMNILDHLTIGPGLQFSSYWHKDKNDYAETKMESLYLPIYGDIRVFFLGKSNDIFLDLAVGGYAHIKTETTMKPKRGSEETETNKGGGGAYFRAGIGGHFVSTLNFAVGYELMKPKNGDAISSVYFRFDMMDLRIRGSHRP
ncbi:MAG: hypothetical protein IJS00_05810 [Paludibacteraceae bacterium]|nr:hypothetical protein [Paludibacteraceae bacterium]